MVARSLILIALLAGAGVYASGASRDEAPAPRTPLSELPMTIGEWRGRDAVPFDDDIVTALGVDDYINRHYIRDGHPSVAVYVGYYASQRQGDTIHSPQNCLPGAGWRPVSFGRVTIDVNGRGIPVNRYLIQKGIEQQAVIYWYQGRGRVVANEYANKLWLMFDAATLGRTSGSLVRMITPVVDTPSAAFHELSAFTTVVFPGLTRYLP